MTDEQVVIAIFVVASIIVGFMRAGKKYNQEHVVEVNFVADDSFKKDAKEVLKEMGYSAKEADGFIAAALVMYPEISSSDELVDRSLEQVEL